MVSIEDIIDIHFDLVFIFLGASRRPWSESEFLLVNKSIGTGLESRWRILEIQNKKDGVEVSGVEERQVDFRFPIQGACRPPSS